MKGRICEIFGSIQGEGLYIGEKQLFVRFFGCNLSCRFCDTKLKYFREYEPKELFEELKLEENGYQSISFTGGEPLLQKDFLKEMLKLTQRNGYKNYLETNGTLYNALEEVIDYLDIVAMDIKLPSSTGLDRFWEAHSRFLQTASKKNVFLKTVICKETKEADLREALKLIRDTNRYAILILQPNSQEDDRQLQEKLENFRQICRQEDISTCIIPQIHRMLGFK